MLDTARARATVLAHGTHRQIARMEALLGAAPAPKEIARALAARQNPDGGFPATDGGASDLLTTCRTLADLRSLPPLGGSPMASRALSYLRRAQAPDGSWSGDPLVTGEALFALALMEPSHPQPAHVAARWLAGMEVAGVTAVLRAAALWLLGARPGGALPDWLAASVGGAAPGQVPPWPEARPDQALALARAAEAGVGGPWHRWVQDGLTALAGAPPDDPESLLLALTALYHTGYLTQTKEGI